MQFELQLRVSDTQVQSVRNTPTVTDGRNTGGLTTDALREATIKTLRQWLERWRVVSDVEKKYEGFPVEDTFRVLGEHLYSTLFDAGLDAVFREVYREASAAGQALKLKLVFHEDAHKLAALPWEFLHTGGRDGFYLAERAVVLKRYIDREQGQAQLVPVRPPLRVLVVLTVPPDEPERQALTDGLNRFDINNLELSTVPSWEDARLDEEIKRHPHVVHLVGHAQYVDQDGVVGVKVRLPGQDGTFDYGPPDPVINLVTRGKSPQQLPRLVILHLCESEPALFTANFERLAPLLIKEGIPAVVAMAYPLRSDVAVKLFRDLYDRLVSGQDLDSIVQDCRYEFARDTHDRRLIGTPVLYMQAEHGVVVEQEPRGYEGVDRHQVNTQFGTDEPAVLKIRLRKVAAGSVEDPEGLSHLAAWVNRVPWPADLQEACDVIRLRMDDDPAYRHAYVAMLDELARTA